MTFCVQLQSVASTSGRRQTSQSRRLHAILQSLLQQNHRNCPLCYWYFRLLMYNLLNLWMTRCCFHTDSGTSIYLTGKPLLANDRFGNWCKAPSDTPSHTAPWWRPTKTRCVKWMHKSLRCIWQKRWYIILVAGSSQSPLSKIWY